MTLFQLQCPTIHLNTLYRALIFIVESVLSGFLAGPCVARPAEKNLKINENSEEGYRETEKRRETEESND